MIGSTPISGTSAPFVQWLGHQIFTLETGVQFPYGVPLQFNKMVGFPSGQRDQTVNLTAQPSKVRILPQPPSKKQVGLSILNELKEKSKKVIWNNDKRKEYYILFSKSGFSQDLIELAKKKSNIVLKELL